jgi:hypothetical protein
MYITGNGKQRIFVEGQWTQPAAGDPKAMPRTQNGLPTKLRNQLNKAVAQILAPNFFKEIPLQDIDNAMRQAGCLLVQEDGTPWSGFFTGREGRAQIDIAPLSSKNEQGMYVPFDNAVLLIMWYKMEQTGLYEVTGYVS